MIALTTSPNAKVTPLTGVHSNIEVDPLNSFPQVNNEIINPTKGVIFLQQRYLQLM